MPNAVGADSLSRTPLYDAHQSLGGKIVPFAGWELPVQYSGIIQEHTAVRTKAGLFDVSHMGEIFVTGPEAEAALDGLTCNAVSTLVDGKAHYSAILNEKGGVVDDIIVYRYSRERYLVCVNASNADKDYAWFTKHNRWKGATFDNQSSKWGQIALQGPLAQKILLAFGGMERAAALQYFHFTETEHQGFPIIVARTGYTGEDGFELFVPTKETRKVWDRLLEVGSPLGLIPAGLGARDSLRLEACYPLHGHELGDDISALASGLGWVIKFDKGDFIGRSALLKEKEAGVRKALVGFYLDDAGISRQGDKVFYSGAEVGVVTSGTKTPTVQRALGLALVDTKAAPVGSQIEVEVRGRRLKASVVKKPFYKRS